jgi:hypothetical protein
VAQLTPLFQGYRHIQKIDVTIRQVEKIKAEIKSQIQRELNT